MTVALGAAWAAVLFGPNGSGRPWLLERTLRVRAQYSSHFRWHGLRAGTSVTDASRVSEPNLIVFMDYSCSFCEKAVASMDSLTQRYPDARIGVRYTMPARTTASRRAAIAALCLEREGRIPVAHNDLFAAARVGSDSAFQVRFAAVMKEHLPTPTASAVLSCVNNPPDAISERLEVDSIWTKRFVVRVTPTFIGQGRRQDGLGSVDVLARVAGVQQ